MALEVGKNSYVTVAQADEHIASHYRSNNTDRQRWDELAEEDKETLLINACAELELLPFQGRKANRDQELSFPRLPFQYGNAEHPPAKVLAAQVELALWLSNDAKQDELTLRQELHAQGITGFSLGDLSETYREGSSTGSVVLLCPKARRLLSPYLAGGFATC